MRDTNLVNAFLRYLTDWSTEIEWEFDLLSVESTRGIATHMVMTE